MDSAKEYATGQIKLYKDDNGYGFIIPDDESVDVFFHITNTVDIDKEELKAGYKVRYTTIDTPKGPNAVEVLKAEADTDK